MLGAYVLFLAISGLAMIAIAVIRGGQTNGARVVNGVVGVAFFGYAFYLAFLFRGGHYFIFFYAFILPILLIVRFFRTLGARSRVPQPQHPNVPFQGRSPYGQPQYGQQSQGAYAQPGYAQPQRASYGEPPQSTYGQPPYGPPAQGPYAPSGPGSYGESSQSTYGQPPYGPPAQGPYAPSGPDSYGQTQQSEYDQSPYGHSSEGPYGHSSQS